MLYIGKVMNRADFHKFFNSPGPVVLPVIHVLNSEQAARNIKFIIREGAPGCFLINHDFDLEEFLPIVQKMRATFQRLWMGVNFLAVTGEKAFPILADLAKGGYNIDAYWADDACIDENGVNEQAKKIAKVQESSRWNGLYFGGTAFKKQRQIIDERIGDAAREACKFMDVITTSGAATGHAAELKKIAMFRAAIGDRPLAIASGITPENAVSFSEVDCFMVATGINKKNNFYELDRSRLARMMKVTRELGKGDNFG